MPENRRPNVLFIMDDQHHADCLGCAGHPDVRTPHIDALAAGGVRFDSAFSQSAICTPSRISYFTGQYPTTHGMHTNAGPDGHCPPHLYSMACHFRDAGYQTAAAGKLHISKWADDGFERKYSCEPGEVPDEYSYKSYLEARNLGEHWRRHAEWQDFMAFVSGVPEEHCVENWTADRTIELLENPDQGKPFFYWMTFERPHAPHSPPPERAGDYDPAALHLPESASDPFFGRTYRERAGVEDIWTLDRAGEETFRRALAYHYALITLIDKNVGRVVAALKRLNLYEDTIIVFCADHGEFAGRHGAIGKNLPGADCLHRIPFVWHWPGRFFAGKVDRQLAETVDVFPTLCDLAGLPVPPTVQGESLAQALKTPNLGPFKKRVFYETHFMRCVRTARFKLGLTYKGKVEGELFDLRDDPCERNNLFWNPKMRDVRLDLAEQLVAQSIRTAQPHVGPRGSEPAPDWPWYRYLAEQGGVRPKDGAY